MSRTAVIRTLFALLAVVFFATPIAARMAGITAESFENRPFAERPKLSQGWEAFGQTTRFLTDRMPLRAQAVRANTRIWTDVFDTTPRYGPAQAPGADEALPFAGAPAEEEAAEAQPAAADAAQVLVGRDGWLFLQGEQDRSCQPFMPFGAAIGVWRGLARQIRAGGKRVLFVVPPDKGSIYPERLPDFPGEACAAAGKRRLWSLLDRAETAAPGRVVALRDDLLAQKRSAGDDLYSRKDSHWTSYGSLALVRAVVGHLGDERPAAGPAVRVRAREVFDPGRAEHTGDLNGLLGIAETDTHAQREIRRAPRAPRIPGRTVLVGDSFSDAPLPQLTPYFEELQVLSWANMAPAQMAKRIERADTVILETVEREVTYRAVQVVPPLQGLLRTGS